MFVVYSCLTDMLVQKTQTTVILAEWVNDLLINLPQGENQKIKGGQ